MDTAIDVRKTPIAATVAFVTLFLIALSTADWS
jgi:hypothetical protein